MLFRSDLSDTKPVWFLCINDSCEQIINDNNFISLVCEGIEDYISRKKNMLNRIKN